MVQLHEQTRTLTGISPFSNHLPVHVSFGDGISEQLPGFVTGSSALAVLDAALEHNSPAVAAGLAALERSGIAVHRHVKAPGEPTTDDVDAAAAALRACGARTLIAIGGGSVIDTAKAARLSAASGRSFAELTRAQFEFPQPTIALIAVPTTAGTGSEVSGGAVITDSQSGRKAGIADASLRPQVALVDPLLTHSVPPALTAYTGVDALAQAIAGMIAKVRTPIGDAIALESVRLIGRSLVAAYRDGADARARSEMACGSLMAGLTMNISDCTAEHSLAQAIGSLTSAPHGLTVGVVLCSVLERERRQVPAQLERVADALGVPDDGTGDASRAVQGVRELLDQLAFPTLSSLGVGPSELDRLTELAMRDFFITQAPAPWTADEVRDAFRAALEER